MRVKTIYTCQNCGAQTPKWMGKCVECNQWNTLVEETYHDAPASTTDAKGHASFRSALKHDLEEPSKPQRLNEITQQDTQRFPTSFLEFDRVLGGGIVPGSLILIGGDPGIGKSTILMQGLSQNLKSIEILYVSGEESAQQIKLRAHRLGMHENHFFIYAENDFESMVEALKKIKPKILIIDSIQTIYSPNIQSAPGSVSQVRECTAKLMTMAKTWGIATFIVGHITKDGSIAGPKVLEHMVDTVLYFEGGTNHPYRILRAVKNRFGSTNEIGVFEMASQGLREVQNPSELFLQERPIKAAGTTVVSAIEGTRPLLVEIQALVSHSALATPRRTVLGMDPNKISLLAAVIEKKLEIPLYGHDIFVNVAGGIKLEEQAADLGAALALISSFRNISVDPKLLICGEVGLTGEVRRVSQLEQRLMEAQKLGFTSALVPKSNLNSLSKDFFEKKTMRILGIEHLLEAAEVAKLVH